MFASIANKPRGYPQALAGAQAAGTQQGRDGTGAPSHGGAELDVWEANLEGPLIATSRGCHLHYDYD